MTQSSPDNERLLPCPFCKRELEYDVGISLTFHPKIPYEEYCPLKSFSFASDRSDIIGAWNTRPDAAATPSKEAMIAAVELEILSSLGRVHAVKIGHLIQKIIDARTPDAAQGSHDLIEGLNAAIRAANLALFVIRKQGVMPNSNWETGFESDMTTARNARNAALALSSTECTCHPVLKGHAKGCPAVTSPLREAGSPVGWGGHLPGKIEP